MAGATGEPVASSIEPYDPSVAPRAFPPRPLTPEPARLPINQHAHFDLPPFEDQRLNAGPSPRLKASETMQLKNID